MDFKIRRAKKEDCPRLLELVHELAVYERAPDEVTVTLEHFTESGFGEKPVWWAFVATTPESNQHNPSSEGMSTQVGTKEVIIGFALYYIRYSTWKGQAMYLEDILVTESMRRMGVGRILFERLIEEAKEKKLKRIVWQVLEWNEPAINFYKKYNATLDPEWVNCGIEVK